jgi:hypothetical protein
VPPSFVVGVWPYLQEEVLQSLLVMEVFSQSPQAFMVIPIGYAIEGLHL